MEKQWIEMTPEEKREVRLKQWLSTEGIKFKSLEASQKYRERTARLRDAVLLNEPDRVPVILPVGNFPAYYAGGNLQKAMYDYEFLRQAWTRFLHDFKDDMDSFNGPVLTYPGRVLEMVNYRLFKWPGCGLGDNVSSYQFVEGEYMQADEYDALIRDPADFMLKTILPRQFGTLEPLEKFPSLMGLYGRPLNTLHPFASPAIRRAFETLIAAGKEMENWQAFIAGFMQETLAEGFTSLRGAMATAPFDILGDSLRGTQGIILDMYRQPEKLLQALDVITPLCIEQTLASINAVGGFIVTFPLHKGDDVFMSDTQFARFYWPTLKRYILALREEGVMSFLFAEGKYMRRLEALQDLPRSWTVWQFDQTDMTRAKQMIGSTACIAGNVPASLMCTGSPADVKDYCRKLIDDCSPGGGFILTGGAQATESTPANFRAMMEAAREFGSYRKS